MAHPPGKPVMRLCVALLLLSAGTAMPAYAGPMDDLVRQEVARRIPDFWQIDQIDVEPLAAGGGADAVPKARFRARVHLDKPTFTMDWRDGAVTFVRPAADAGLEKAVAGTAVGLKADGGLAVKVEFGESFDILASVGTPLTELPGRTVLSTSDEGRKLRVELAAEAERRRIAERQRRGAEEATLAEQTARAKAETERLEAERQAVKVHAQRIAELSEKLGSRSRPDRIAAFDAAIKAEDPSLRQLAMENALQGRDGVLGNLAIKNWLRQRKSIQVQLFAIKEDTNSDAVLGNLGPLTLTIEAVDEANGAVTATLGAPGYGVTRPSSTAGGVTRTDLALNTYGCALTLRLTEHRTLDGLYRCQTLPTLIARIVLD